ncbi:ribonuclease Z [Thermodesulfobacteriota bacterium]
MRPSLHPRLINDPFLDPGLYIPFLFDKRAVMFDLGELGILTPRDILKVSHIFVTHTHMDHFIGFDKLLRICLGRDKELHLFGPTGFFSQVEGKLRGYTWNLVNEYENNFILCVSEIHEDKLLTRKYICRKEFSYNGTESEKLSSGIIHKDPRFQVKGILLDHRTPCIGLSLNENFSVNINKEKLEKLGLDVGPWITRFKRAVYENSPDDLEFTVTWEEKGTIKREKKFPLGELTREIASISPGQKITYITDVIGTPENCKKIIDLAKNSDHLFIEAAFMNKDIKAARKKYHLTAGEAGELARKAEVKKLTLFHFSPRYSHMEEELVNEAMNSFKP